MDVIVSTEINKPKSEVWSAITDISHCTDMISAIIELTILHQPEDGLVGLKWTETREMFGKKASETMWITASEHEKFYKTRAESCGSIYVTTMELSSEADTTRLTMTFNGSANSIFVSAISAVMSFFIKKSMVKMLEKDLNDIKTFVESKK